MPIDDVDTPFTRGWWFRKLAKEQVAHLPRQIEMRERFEGDPPLPEGAANAREAYASFQKKARTNYEEMITEAVRERQTPVAIRMANAQPGDQTGDAKAAQLWAVNEMPVQSADVLEYMGSMGDGYTIIGPPTDDSDGQAVITAEDPRQVITSQDPLRPSRARAALKTFFDEDLERDVAYLYLPAGIEQPGGGVSQTATIHRARREGKSSVLGPKHRFSPRAWTWDDEVGVLARTKRCPVVRFRNRRGVAEFEPHIDAIDRIRDSILKRMVIVTMQAFRQRAAKGLPLVYPDGHPQAGQEIDYEGIFTADPGAVWLLPGASDLWESQPPDIGSILNAIKDDEMALMSVTRTPFYMRSPDAAQGSAAGAQLQREGLVFKVADRNTRAGIGFDLTNSIAFELMGDPDRAKPGALETMWAPVERFTMAEKYDAAVKAKAAGMPRRAIFIEVLQFTPAQADRMLGEAADDFLFGAVDVTPEQAVALTAQPPAQVVRQAQGG